jgi:hypothetical protein
MASDRTQVQGSDALLRAQQLSLQRTHTPTQVPGYQPQRFLGEGAYGEVWVAVERNTGRNVAIKFYSHRGGLDWSLLSREVEKLAFLSADRYVVQLVEVGWDAEPPYYVMEYLERGSLEDRLKDGPLPVSEAVSLFREVAIGLVHAHGKGILHCDLKPGNVLLDQDWKPRLADFGQSRLSTEQSPALGTLFYMAPEQADLAAVPDARWDVYALGALLYCMLTGQPPHRNDVAAAALEQAGALPERLAAYRRLISEAPPPRAHRTVRGVDRDLIEIIDRCLAVKPAKRYPNVQAVLDALAARAQRKARMPLLVLGLLGPALLLLVVTIFAWNALSLAVQEPIAMLSSTALQSNRFAAQFVAQAVARKLDRRWRVLEEVADKTEFRALVQPAAAAGRDDPARQRLQEEIESLHRKYAQIKATSWFVTDRQGKQLVRSPLEPATIDKTYAYRDYFHGEGRDYPPGTVKEPIRRAHRSVVFTSQATNNRMVAFSVPIWSDRPDAPGADVIGVLAMTVELGFFAELHPDGAAGAGQIAVLVDSKADENGQKGSLLEHPYLSELLREHKQLPGIHLGPEWIERFEKLRDKKRALVQNPPGGDLVLEPNYEDPVGKQFAGRWLAALEPVFVEDRPEKIGDTGWIVIVQQRYRRVTNPVQDMGMRLLKMGLIALGVVLAAVIALWGFVIRVLNDPSRSGILASIQRRLGSSGDSSSTPSAPTTTGSVRGAAADSAHRRG